jgi:hypothetical protein
MGYSKDIHHYPQDYLDVYEGMIKKALSTPTHDAFFLPIGDKGKAYHLAMRNNAVRGAILRDYKHFIFSTGYYDPAQGTSHVSHPPYDPKLAGANAGGFTFVAHQQDGVWGVLCHNSFSRLKTTCADVGFDLTEFLNETTMLDHRGERIDTSPPHTAAPAHTAPARNPPAHNPYLIDPPTGTTTGETPPKQFPPDDE